MLHDPDLLEEYEKFNNEDVRTHEFWINHSRAKLAKLNESLLDLKAIPKIFMMNQMSFHFTGSDDLIEEYRAFKSSDKIDASNQFAKKVVSPESIDRILMFFTLKYNQQRLSEIETILLHNYRTEAIFDWLNDMFPSNFIDNSKTLCFLFEFIHGIKKINTLIPQKAFEESCMFGFDSIAKHLVEKYSNEANLIL